MHGHLVNDNDPNSRIPYFMTANHRLSTQSVADTINSYWFFERATCEGPNPTSVIQFAGGADFAGYRHQHRLYLPALAGCTNQRPAGHPICRLDHDQSGRPDGGGQSIIPGGDLKNGVKARLIDSPLDWSGFGRQATATSRVTWSQRDHRNRK